tara:strand:+ start:4627 stop:4884 length:258 start_codon:yes stop_codon:yes gene_type:complete
METPTDYDGVVALVINFINILIPAIIALLFVWFVWKVIDAWVINAGDQTKRDEGKKYAIAAVVSMVLIVSAWGIVNLVVNSIFGR